MRPLAAAAALSAGNYIGADDNGEEAITDLIADLLHLAAALRLDPVKVHDLGLLHYQEEASEPSPVMRACEAPEPCDCPDCRRAARDEWCPHCREYHAHPIGERTDAGQMTKPCPRKADDPNWRLA